MKSLLHQPPPSVEGKGGRSRRLWLTSTHITAVPGIFTSVSIPAAAAPPCQAQLTGTNRPDRGLDRHLHTQEHKQWDAGQTNFLFSKARYYHTDTMALLQIHLGSLSRTNPRPRRKDKALQQPPRGISSPHTPGNIPSLLRTPLGRGWSF